MLLFAGQGITSIMTELTVAERALLERFLEALRELPEVRAAKDRLHAVEHKQSPCQEIDLPNVEGPVV